MKSSIRNKILLMTLLGLLQSTLLVGGMGIYCANSFAKKHASEQLLGTSEKETVRITAKLQSIEQYVKTLNFLVTDELTSLSIIKDSSSLSEFTNENLNFIRSTIKFVPSAVAVYLRFNPKLTPPTSGIFMAKTSLKSGIQKQIPTDFSKYNSEDVEHVGWYYIPIRSGKPTWMSPYKNKNINVYMISYVEPIFRFGEEIGVVGVDIDFDYLASEIAKIKLFKTGYAYLEDVNGKVAYHPTVPYGEDFTVSSDYESIRSNLPNGMQLVLVVPKSEIYEERDNLILRIIVFAIVILLIYSLITTLVSRTITKPLRELTKAANQMTSGNLNVSFDISTKDEIGTLAKSFTNAQKYISEYLGYIKGVAYKDSLTGVRNKTSYDNFIHDLQQQVENKLINEYALVVVDVNGLKKINDTFGHDHGNMLLINACKLICTTFNHSPVFRIGGDEFAVILQRTDYTNREKIMFELQENMAMTKAKASLDWEKVSLACGMAIYDSSKNEKIEDVFKRADFAMYQNKKAMKIAREA